MAQPQEIQFQEIQLKIGSYTVHSVPTGIFGLDGGAMFGTVPKVLWEKTNPPDDQNRIPLEARAMLLRSQDRNILVDVGVGSDFTEKYGEKLGAKFSEIYAVQKGGATLSASLKHLGLTENDITDVILTHLHFDHAGGGTRAENGQIVPTFPKATYYVQKANLETAQSPNLREKASYFAANFDPLIEADVLKVIDGDQDLFEGIRVFVTNGHTQGQQLVEVSSEKTKLIYCGDIIPTSSHVRLPFVMGYDLNPLLVIEEKKQILNRVASANGYLFFEHDPYCDSASIYSEGADYRVRERLRLV